MNSPLRPACLLALAALALAPAARAADNAATDALQKNFAAPPMDTRPLVRWWWFGPAVVKPELEKEMNFMKEGGFGGFEVQPTYPLALDGQYPNLVNLKFLSPEFFDMLGFAASKAKELNLRMDLTIGSGWPYGGPMVTREDSAQTLAEGGSAQVSAGETTVSPPAGGGGRGGRGGRGGAAASPAPLVAALLGPVTDAAPGASPYIALKIDNGVAQLPANLHGATQVIFFTDREGIMAVKRPAYGAEGLVVDHYGPTAIKNYIDAVALPEINACGPNAPFSIFCDSLEINGEGWTPDFLADFQKYRGYDLTPLLPALFDANFPKAAEVREDYCKTVVEVFNNNFVKTFEQLAKDHDTRFRIQAYGTPPTDLTTYADADLDEGEQYNWRVFSATRWAASASHVLDRPMASAEAFTWTHQAAFMSDPMDIKAESNLDFLNGINAFCCHGWPYSAPGVEYPGWRFYAAGVFDEKNPWWIAMNDVTTYLARASYLLRQGAPANDVGIYLAEEDGYSDATPSSLSTAAASGGLFTRGINNLIPTILDSGYDFDFIDDGVLASHAKVDGDAMAFGNSKYRIIVLPPLTRIPLATLQKFANFANNGGILIATGSLPSQAPGYLATDAENKAIQDLAAKIFTGPGAKGLVVSLAQLGATMQGKLRPDVAYSKTESELGFVHRHTDGGEIYFLVNTSPNPVSDTAIIREDGLNPEWWDPTTGRVTPVTDAKKYSGATGIPVSLPAYGAQFLVFTSRTLAAPAPGPSGIATPAPLDLSKGWSVSFKNSAPGADPAPMQLDAGTSWLSIPALQSFSGVATYEKQVDVPALFTAGKSKVMLNFGEGQPAGGGGGRGGNGMNAAYDSPVGDVAVVWVNGQRAGAVWCPPFQVDVSSFLKPGANQIRIQVANRATNYMVDTTDHPAPDMSSVNTDPRLGGNRFQNQGNVQANASGLLGPVTLVAN